MKGNAGTQRTAGGRQRKPSRLVVARRRRTARKAEAYIASYVFPTHIAARVRRRSQLDEAGWKLVEQGLREWFVCCAWRGRTILGMPSRLVDEAWHEFILDSLSYTRFCEMAFGGYLHHTPDEATSTPMGRCPRRHRPRLGPLRGRQDRGIRALGPRRAARSSRAARPQRPPAQRLPLHGPLSTGSRMGLCGFRRRTRRRREPPRRQPSRRRLQRLGLWQRLLGRRGWLWRRRVRGWQLRRIRH